MCVCLCLFGCISIEYMCVSMPVQRAAPPIEDIFMFQRQGPGGPLCLPSIRPVCRRQPCSHTSASVLIFKELTSLTELLERSKWRGGERRARWAVTEGQMGELTGEGDGNDRTGIPLQSLSAESTHASTQ